MLWQWEKNHKFENWSFAEQFTEKIKTLVSFKDNMTNFLQFVKLFQEQLVLVFDIFIQEQSFLVLFYILLMVFNSHCINKMCKDDRTIIDNKNDQANGPEQMNTAFDPMKLKRSFILLLIYQNY